MWDALQHLFFPTQYIPHGHCYLWQTPLVLLHLFSDLLIGLAYFSIPVLLIYFVYKRHDVPFSNVFILFGTFIVLCGTGHLLEIWTLWHPAYWLTGIEKAATGVVSFYTALQLNQLLPQFLALRTPEELEAINRELQAQIAISTTAHQKLQQSQLALHQLNEQLELKVTERTAELALANYRLQENLRLLDSVIESIPDPVFLKDCEGRYLLLNTATSDVIGRPKTLILGHTDDQLFPSDIANLLMHRDRVVINSGKTQIFEDEILQHRTIRTFLATKRTWQDEDGTVKGVLGIARDITDRKLAEQTLQERERFLRTIGDNIPNGFIFQIVRELNGSYRFTYVSAGVERIYGVKPEAVLADAGLLFNKLAEADLAYFIQQQEESARNLTDFDVQVREQLLEGSRWIRIRSTPHRLADGRVAWDGYRFDINDLKQTEETLRQSEARLRLVLENMPVMLDAFDENGNIIVWNQECERVTGYTAEEVTHNSQVLKLLYPNLNYRQQMIRNWQKQGNNYRNWEWDLVSKSGEVKTIAWSNISDRFAIPGWASWGIGVDLTSRKQAELEIVLLNQTLEQRVNQRTAELSAANQELEAFSYSVSHDLRAPLRGIDGFSQILQDRYGNQLDAKGKHYLERIRAGTQRMDELIDDLLMLSRVTRTEIRRESVNLSAIAQEICQSLHAAQPDRSVEWVIESTISGMGDARLLRIVLENLFSNAWKFTSTQAQTQIKFGTISSNDAPLTYFIQDNGVGFNMAYVNKLFKAFQRLHSEREFCGTGIGLAIVQRIVHRHGGSVRAEGTVKQGATFYFTLG
jgi:PAS domain S-box-containing protein